MRCIPMKRREDRFMKKAFSLLQQSLTAADLAPFQREADAQGVPLDSYLEAWAGNITRKLRGSKHH